MLITLIPYEQRRAILLGGGDMLKHLCSMFFANGQSTEEINLALSYSLACNPVLAWDIVAYVEQGLLVSGAFDRTCQALAARASVALHARGTEIVEPRQRSRVICTSPQLVRGRFR